MRLVPLKQAPSSSDWSLAAVRGDTKYWRSRSGKLFAQQGTQWFAVKMEPKK